MYTHTYRSVEDVNHSRWVHDSRPNPVRLHGFGNLDMILGIQQSLRDMRAYPETTGFVLAKFILGTYMGGTRVLNIMGIGSPSSLAWCRLTPLPCSLRCQSRKAMVSITS